MKTITDKLVAISEKVYEINIDGVWYVDVSDLSDKDKEKVEELTNKIVYDEDYFICDNCGKAHFANNGYVQLPNVIFCPKCMREITINSYYFDTYIALLINNYKMADKYLSDKSLTSIGFKKIHHVYRIGSYEDDNSNPKDILKKYQNYDVIFKIIEQNSFEVEYCIYIR